MTSSLLCSRGPALETLNRELGWQLRRRPKSQSAHKLCGTAPASKCSSISVGAPAFTEPTNPEALSRILAQMYKLLKRQLPEHRRALLQGFLSESQRLTLERWMLDFRSSQHSTAARSADALPPTKRRKAISAQESTVETPAASPADCVPRAGREIAQRMPSSAVLVSALELKELPRVHQEFGIMRNRQPDGCYYSAQVAVGSLRLLSKADRDFDQIATYRAVLLDIKQRTLHVGAASFECRFRDAVRSSLADHAIDARAFGLRFKVSLRLLWVTSPLCTRAYRIEQMEAGLAACRLLRAARGEAHRGQSRVVAARSPHDLSQSWANLRDAYLKVMTEAGCNPERIRMKLDRLTMERMSRQEQQVRTWNRLRMAMEDHAGFQRRQLSPPIGAPGVPAKHGLRLGQVPSDLQRAGLERGRVLDAKVARATLRSLRRLLRRWAQIEAHASCVRGLIGHRTSPAITPGARAASHGKEQSPAVAQQTILGAFPPSVCSGHSARICLTGPWSRQLPALGSERICRRDVSTVAGMKRPTNFVRCARTVSAPGDDTGTLAEDVKRCLNVPEMSSVLRETG